MGGVGEREAREGARAVVEEINRAWREGRPGDIGRHLDDQVVMVFPGFEGRSAGRGALVAGYVDFATHADVHMYSERDHHVDVWGDTAVVGYRFEMVYSRDGDRFRSTGRDLFVLRRADDRWVATWRTMLDVQESALP